MTELEREILEGYQVRKTKAQKTAFITFLTAHFPELKIEEGGFPTNRNLVLGDIDKAEILLTAHYDTCIRSPLPNLMMPLRPGLKGLYSMLLIVPMLAIALLAGWLVFVLTDSQELLLTVYLAVYFGLFGFLFLWGKPNEHTANDNTSGVITLLRIYRSMTDAQKEKAAIVLFDNEEYGCRGSAWLNKQRKEAMKEKLVLNFDCVSDGDHFLLVTTEDAMTHHGDALKASFVPGDGKQVTFADSKKASLSSDHKNFPRSVGIAAMHEHKYLKLCCGRIHTPKDTVFQPENITWLAERTLSFLDTLG